MPEIRTYAEQAVRLITAWRIYALAHDTDSEYRAAEAVVTNDLKMFMKDTGERDRSTASRLRREQIRNLELSLRSDVSKYRDNQMDDPGAELAKITQRNLEICPHLSYAQAKRFAILENPRLGERYMGRAVAYDRVGEVQQFFAEAAQLTKRYDISPSVIISNIVTGLPRLADNSIDMAAAVQAVNSFGGDTLQRACQEELEKLVRTQIAIDGTPGSEANRPEMLRQIRAKVRRKYPGLATAADGNPITERGLRELFPQHFK